MERRKLVELQVAFPIIFKIVKIIQIKERERDRDVISHKYF